MEKDAKRDSKLFNIYNGSVVRNWQPQQLHCFRLDTSVGYSTWRACSASTSRTWCLGNFAVIQSVYNILLAKH